MLASLLARAARNKQERREEIQGSGREKHHEYRAVEEEFWRGKVGIFGSDLDLGFWGLVGGDRFWGGKVG
jgi:hypothetical protein